MRIKRSFLRKLSPFSWSQRQIRLATLGFFALALPAYLFYGLQPATEVGAATYPRLEIAAVGLEMPVEPLELTTDNQLIAPAAVPGSYATNEQTTLLIGHSTTAFSVLDEVALGDEIAYDSETYTVVDITTVAKSEVDMRELLAAKTSRTLVLMTCAGEYLGGQDYSERLIITATH